MEAVQVVEKLVQKKESSAAEAAVLPFALPSWALPPSPSLQFPPSPHILPCYETYRDGASTPNQHNDQQDDDED
eukprot:scaffold3126_cov136-Amphora_coffeaeformis.AAC.1